MNKKEWMNLVGSTLMEHPEWTAETMQAVQDGILSRLNLEIEEKSNLAYGFAWLANAEAIKRDGHRISKGLRSLKRFFLGTAFGDSLPEFEEE